MAWNQTSGKTTSRSGNDGRLGILKGAIAGLVVALGAVAVIFFVFMGRKNIPVDPSPEKSKSSRIVDNGANAVVSKTIDEVEVKKDENKQRIAKLRKMSEEDRENYIFEEMKKKPIDLTPKTNRIFRTGVEASMCRIFMTELGDPPPPPFTTIVPLRDEAHLAEILIANNPELPTDTAAQRESKQMVEIAKAEMRQYIKEGGEASEFLNYYYGKLQEAFLTRQESMKSLIEIARDDPEIASAYLEKINEKLSSKGIKTIDLDEKQRKRLGLED